MVGLLQLTNNCSPGVEDIVVSLPLPVEIHVKFSTLAWLMEFYHVKSLLLLFYFDILLEVLDCILCIASSP